MGDPGRAVQRKKLIFSVPFFSGLFHSFPVCSGPAADSNSLSSGCFISRSPFLSVFSFDPIALHDFR